MSAIVLKVVAGKGCNKEVVGTITAREGLSTSAGTISRVTKNTVLFDDGARRLKLDAVTVSHTEAMKFGYPHASGCARSKVRQIKRAGALLPA